MRHFISKRRKQALTVPAFSRERRHVCPQMSSMQLCWRWMRTKAKEAGQEVKKAVRERKKALREQLEKEWAEMKRQHTVKLEAWTEECAQLLEGGTRKKDIPPKPKLGKKPQLPVLDDAGDDDEDEVEEPMDDGDV